MRISRDEFSAQVVDAAADENLVRLVFSGKVRHATPQSPRVDLRPVLIGGARHLQQVRVTDGKHVSANVAAEEAKALVDALLEEGYGNVTVTTTKSVTAFRVAKGGDVFRDETPRESEQDLNHDRRKQRLLDPADPLLIAVGVSSSNGQVKAKWADKYRQVDDFLRIVTVTLERAIAAGHIPEPTTQAPLKVVDLGCGHAYLTFGLQAWLERVKGWPAQIVGVDIKADSMQRNRELAQRLGLANMEFHASSIADYSPDSRVNVVLALHACDTATDDALAWAVRNRAAVVFSVPCCHHDFQRQIGSHSPTPYGPIAKHGILRERFADLLTDAARASVMRAFGYRVDVIEFVSSVHTPRNLMIRAVLTDSKVADVAAEELGDLLKEWKVEPTLVRLLNE